METKKEALPVENGRDEIANKNPLPESGFIRLPQIVGNKKTGIPAIIPVSKSTWWAGVKSGRYPQPVKLSKRCTAWRVEDIRALCEQMAGG